MPSTYVSLPELREAIRSMKIVRFDYAGEKYEVEPAALDAAPRTGALVLIGLVRSPGTERWRTFRYSGMRDFKACPEKANLRAFPGFRVPSVEVKG